MENYIPPVALCRPGMSGVGQLLCWEQNWLLLSQCGGEKGLEQVLLRLCP